MTAADKPSVNLSRSDETAVNADAESTQKLTSLIDECLLAIFQLLPVTDRIKMERVCRRWKVLIPKSFANIKCLEMPHKSYLYYGQYGGQSAILEALVNRIGPYITAVDFTYPLSEPFGRTDLVMLGSKCPKLTKVACDTTTFSPLAVRNFGDFLGRIESLKVTCTSDRTPDADYEMNLRIGLSRMANLKHLEVHSSFPRGTFLQTVAKSLLSIDLSLKNLEEGHLEEFIHAHPRLKRFQICFSCRHQNPQQTPILLARYCHQLTYLSISGHNHYSSLPHAAFATAFRSFPQLKELDVRDNGYFTDAALKNVSRYSFQLESLRVGDEYENDCLSLEGLMSIGNLKKLKCLEIVRRCDVHVDDEFVAVLCAGSGATLEQLSFRSENVTDASLKLLGIKCGNLAELDVQECPKFTLVGLNDFVTAISNDPSWTDPTKNRRLHITVGLAKSFQNGVDEINRTTKHRGRLVVTNIAPMSITTHYPAPSVSSISNDDESDSDDDADSSDD